MPILYQEEVVRKPGSFSAPTMRKLAFFSHLASSETRKVRSWCRTGTSNYNQMIAEMDQFLTSKEAISALDQFPAYLQPALSYAIDFREDFSLDAFLAKVDLKKLGKDVSFLECGSIDPTSPFLELMNKCADTALAIHKTKNFSNKLFDEKYAFKVMDLLVHCLRVGKEKFAHINGKEYLKRPFILNVPCIAALDPCVLKIAEERPVPKASEEKADCPCDDLKKKEQACSCESSDKDPCSCDCDDACHEQDACCAKQITTYVADLYVVKDDVSRYKPGDIARIENIMKGEERTKKHRHLQREESYSETEEENNTFSERSTQIDERSAVHKEVEKIVETDLSVDAGASYSSRAGSEKTYKSFSASIDGSYNQSKKDARKFVQDNAKNIITRAVEKVEKKMRTLTSHRMINEIEENNKHVFDGREFAEHENGIYFFVNQERKAQVYNHGVRAQLDFFVPDPSKRLKALLEQKFDLKRPQKPCMKIKDIDPDDHLDYIQCYGFTDLPKLDTSTEIIKLIVQGENEPIENKRQMDKFHNESGSMNFVVPDGYVATMMKIDGFNSTHRDEEFWSKVYISVGAANVYIEHNDDANSWSHANNTKLSNSLDNLEGSNTLSYQNYFTTTYNITIHIICELHPDQKLEWQLDVYNRIMAKYEKDLADYERALSEFNRNKQDKFDQNPFMLSETIKKQLKHSALEYITCQFFDEKNGMRNNVQPCGLPQMNIREAEKFGEKVRFLEHAFEWKFMSYMLYPYFYADKCSWSEKLQEEASNGLFQEFLQSGEARISVSIRPGFEELVQYFLEEGELWGGLGLPAYGDPTYLPIHQEIKESKDNFNADRDGYLIWDSSHNPSLRKDEIILRNDTDPVEYFDATSTTPILDPIKVAADLNRIIVIDCIEYRIVDITLENGEVIIKLDRDLDHKDPINCPEDFDQRYKDRNKLWSTGAKFVGAPWAYIVPTSYTWLKEDECLPSYPITCKEGC